MMGLGTTEIVVIAAVLVVLFGAKRIPDRQVARVVRERLQERPEIRSEGRGRP